MAASRIDCQRLHLAMIQHCQLLNDQVVFNFASLLNILRCVGCVVGRRALQRSLATLGVDGSSLMACNVIPALLHLVASSFRVTADQFHVIGDVRKGGGIDTVEAVAKGSGRTQGGMGQIKAGIAQCLSGLLVLIQGSTAAETEPTEETRDEDRRFFMMVFFYAMVGCCLVGAVCGWKLAGAMSRFGAAVRSNLRLPLLPWEHRDVGIQTDGRPIALGELTVEAIRLRLQRRGQTTGGSKSDLVARLRAVETGWPFEV